MQFAIGFSVGIVFALGFIGAILVVGGTRRPKAIQFPYDGFRE